MDFKAIFQGFREGRRQKFIDVKNNFRLFPKNVTKFAGLQTLKVTCTCA